MSSAQVEILDLAATSNSAAQVEVTEVSAILDSAAAVQVIDLAAMVGAGSNAVVNVIDLGAATTFEAEGLPPPTAAQGEGSGQWFSRYIWKGNGGGLWA